MKVLKRMAAALAARRAELAVDAAGLAGVAALVEGAREIYAPAGWLVAGVCLLAYAVVVNVKGTSG